VQRPSRPGSRIAPPVHTINTPEDPELNLFTYIVEVKAGTAQ
jgi:hypothetical protein